MRDIDPIQPLSSTNWTKLVRRKGHEEDEGGNRHEAFEEEPEDEGPTEDEDGVQHIDIRV